MSYGLVLPRRKIRSDTLLHWRASDLTLRPLFGPTPTFTRAAAGGLYLDTNGRLVTAVHSQPRWASAMKGGPVGLLLEETSTNLVANSENFGAWNLSGTPVLTGSQRDPAGGTAAYLIEDNDGAVNEFIWLGVTYTGNGRKAVSVFVKQGTAARFYVSAWDNTAAVHRHSVVGVWGSDGVPVLSTVLGAGEIFTPIRCVDGWWRICFTATGVVAANVNRLYVYPSGDSSTYTGTSYFYGAQAENLEAPSSYIRTTGATASRTAESFIASDAKIAPKATTVYQRWTEVGGGMKMATLREVLSLKGASGRYFVAKRISDTLRGYAVEWASGVSANLTAASLQYGDEVELMMSIDDTTGRAELAVNGVSVATGSGSVAAAAWWPSLTWTWPGGTRSVALYHAFKVARGARTLDEMREIA